MKEENKNKSLIGRIIDFIAKIFSIKQKKEKKKESRTEDIYPMW